jgi:CheY-specific phosphatase CheX
MSVPTHHSTVASAASRYTATQWREALDGAASEVARYALGFAGAQVGAPTALDPNAALVGAHIALVGGQPAELSLMATPPDCAVLASAVLGMAVAQLPPATVRDAIGEISNMLAGGVKRRLPGNDLELGLPVFGDSSVEVIGGQARLVFPLQLGPVATFVVILGDRG